MKYPGMFSITLYRNPFEVLKDIIRSYTIDVINFLVVQWRRSVERTAYESVNCDDLLPFSFGIDKPNVFVAVLENATNKDQSCSGSAAPYYVANISHGGDFVIAFPSGNRQPLFFHGGMLSQEIV